MDNTLELNKLTDEQVEKELKDIQAKKDHTPEEKETLNNLKEERQTRYQKRIDKLSYDKKREAEENARLKAELEAQKTELAEIKKHQQAKAKPTFKEETVEFGGQKFYTDDTLTAMVNSEELTPAQAYQHQRQRDKAEIMHEIEAKATAKTKEDEDRKIRQEDYANMVKEYPHFDVNHPDHDPNDPLYKTANELWLEGLRANPRGLAKAIQRAKQILRMNDASPDLTNEHSVGKSRIAASHRQPTDKEAVLSPEEKDAAIRIYGGVINPVTKRNYTEAEAILKATKAKTARMRD